MSAPTNKPGSEDLEKQLLKILESVFQKMMDKGQISGDAVKNKDVILNNLAKELIKNPDIKTCVQDKSLSNRIENHLIVEETFKLAIISEAAAVLSKNPKMRLDYDVLFTSQREVESNQKDAKTSFKDELKKELLKFLFNVDDGPKKSGSKEKLNSKELDVNASLLSRFIHAIQKKLNPNKATDQLDKKEDKTASKDKKPGFEESCQALTLALISLYGVDPSQTGKVAVPVLAVMGNPAGQVDLSEGRDGSFFGDQNEARPGQADPTGAEQFAIGNLVSAGTGADELAQTLYGMLEETNKEHNSRMSPFKSPGDTPTFTRNK